jgi:3-hydroxyacyl-CoA dehydrogenase
MPMGPIELSDVVGLDVAAARRGDRHARTAQARSPAYVERTRAGAGKQLGRKSGEGFYVWRDGKACAPPDGQRPRIWPIA